MKVYSKYFGEMETAEIEKSLGKSFNELSFNELDKLGIEIDEENRKMAMFENKISHCLEVGIESEPNCYFNKKASCKEYTTVLSYNVFLEGKTYPIKEDIKVLGGKWEKSTKTWRIEVNSLQAIKNIVTKFENNLTDITIKQAIVKKRIVSKSNKGIKETITIENFTE